MAIGSKLVLVFADGDGKNVTFNYSYANPEVSTANVKALVAGLITNKDIFENPPVTARTAKIVTTTETDYDIE